MPIKQNGKSKADARLKVLIIYQGNHAKYFQEHVSAHIAGKFSEEIELILTKYNEKAFETNIFEAFQNDVAQCDAAIAIVTPDIRPASAAGNLWLEIGIWIGLKSSKMLLVCIQESPSEGGSSKHWPEKVSHKATEKLPSDILGQSVPRFDSEAKLDNHVDDHIRKLLESKKKFGPKDIHSQDGSYLEKMKIRDTIMCGELKWDFESSSCPSCGDDPCQYWLQSISFISELLRMGRVNREHSIIESCLHQIGKKYEALQASDLSNPINGNKVRGDVFELTSILEVLADTARDLLKRNDNFNPNIESPWMRIHNYLQYRLNLASKVKIDWGRLNIAPIVHDQLIDRLKKFCNWAEKCLHKDSNYQKIDPNNWEEFITKEFGNITQCGEFAKAMAYILEEIGKEYFDGCRAVIRQELEKVGEPQHLSITLKKIREDLPHNIRIEENKLRIWPRPMGRSHGN